jgi:hypothetical protein
VNEQKLRSAPTPHPFGCGAKLTLWRRDVNQVMRLDFEGPTDAMLDHVIEGYDPAGGDAFKCRIGDAK